MPTITHPYGRPGVFFITIALVSGLSCPLAHALPEGSQNLGLLQGLDARTQVRVTIATPGEIIRFCSSDDGIQDANIGDSPVDLAPGEENPVRLVRQREEIVIYSPTAMDCQSNDGCPMGQACYDLRAEARVNSVNADELSDSRKCGRAYPVNPTSDPGLGQCTAQDPAVRPHELIADEAGIYRFDFVGEPETLRRGTTSTRFFEIDVLTPDPDRNSVTGGRVSSVQWLLGAFASDYAMSTRLFIRRPSGEQAYVFALDLEEFRGNRYNLLTNGEGINAHQGESWCLYGDPKDDQTCPNPGDADLQLVYAQFPIFLNEPGPPTPTPPETEIGELSFNDNIGTNTISPDGDGNQDSGIFSFTTNRSGEYSIRFDINNDGRFDGPEDHILSGTAEAGRIEIEWDGTGANGTPLAPGRYPIQFRLRRIPVHLPWSNIPDNRGGFAVSLKRQPGDNPFEPRALHWDDLSVRTDADLIDAMDLLFTAPDGTDPAAPIRRRWIQRPAVENGPIIHDTWFYGEDIRLTAFTCTRCEEPIDAIVVSPDNEAPDEDGDTLLDNEEDIDGDGVVDPGETDPKNPDTDGDGIRDDIEKKSGTDPTRTDSDGDGISDGQEDANQNGQLDDGETDPKSPDSDGDGLADGAEDRNGDGQVGPGETDPNNPDSDGDGRPDGDDPFPLDRNDELPIDAGVPSAAAADTAASGGQGATSASMGGIIGDVQPNSSDTDARRSRLDEEAGVGCDCNTTQDNPAALLGLLALMLSLRTRRRR